ncbi:MAG TPA: TonB-dependent receptor [Opitutaceae bacterium]|jgi:iron complex outermembrane receptor protein|nr:TonB-dependent receptor [Opitutaceae bacterium]
MNIAAPGSGSGERRRAALAALILSVAAAAAARGQIVAGNLDVPDLKKLSIESLMDTPVTSVSRYAEKLQEAAASIEVVSNEDIVRSGAELLPDALRLADNLEVAQKDPHDWAISARGFNANEGDKMLVQIDGRSVYSPLFSGVFWNAQDTLLEDVEQIEVISGPGGTLWGANAVNGVINVTTKSAQETQGAYVESGGGGELESFAAGRYGGVLAPNVYYRVYAKFSSFGPGTLADGLPAADGWNQGQGGFRIDAAPAPDTALNLQGDFYGSNLDLQSGGNARMGGGNLMGHWSRDFSDSSHASAQAYYERDTLTDPFGPTPFSPEGPLRSITDTYDAQFQDDFSWGPREHLVWGLEYRFVRNDIVQESPSAAFLPPLQNETLGSAFLQDDLALTAAVHLIAGTKLEHNEYTGWEWEPNLRLRWDIGERQTAWAAVSRAVRTPSRFDRDLYEPNPPPELIAGGPDFRSETLLAYEIGYRAQIGPKVSGTASIFYDDYDRIRSLGITPVTILPVSWQNNLEAWNAGLELSGDAKLADWWRLHAGYDLLREHVWQRPGTVDIQNALGETADPENQVFLRSSFDLPGHVALDAAGRWIDSLVINANNAPGTVPAYGELDLRLAWRATDQLEFSVVGQNLLQAHHAEYNPPGPAQEEIDRNIYGKIAWHY